MKRGFSEQINLTSNFYMGTNLLERNDPPAWSRNIAVYG